MFIKKWLKIVRSSKQKPHLNPESDFSVNVDQGLISMQYPDGRKESLRMTELLQVTIQTTDSGPFVPDVFWLLISGKKTLRIPQGTSGDEVLLEALQALPGFDNRLFIEAMGSTSNREFVCWKKSG